MKKILVVYLLVFGIGAQSLVADASAYRFRDDADIPTWALESVYELNRMRIITGFPDGTFGPEQPINRAQALVILFRALEKDDSKATQKESFRDVPVGQWYHPAIEEAHRLDWITGYPDGTYRPAQQVNRAEWVTLVSRAYSLTSDQRSGYEDVPSMAWFHDSVSGLEQHALIRKFGQYFDPHESVTRAEAAWMVFQIISSPELDPEYRAYLEHSQIARDARNRVAIRPRDFDPDKQGNAPTQNRVEVETITEDTPLTYTRAEIDAMGENDWLDIGRIRVHNEFPDEDSTLLSLTLRSNFVEGIGSTENGLIYRLVMPNGDEHTRPGGTGGETFFANVNLKVEADDEEQIQVLLRIDTEASVFLDHGLISTKVAHIEANLDSDSAGSFRIAPTGLTKPLLREVEFWTPESEENPSEVQTESEQSLAEVQAESEQNPSEIQTESQN